MVALASVQGDPKHPWDAVKSLVIPGRKEPWSGGTQQAEPQGGKSQRHLGPVDQVGCPGGYLGLRARCRFKRLIEAFWQL